MNGPLLAVLPTLGAVAALFAQVPPELAQSAPQPPAANRPLGAQRIVQRFDFEEYDTNPNPVPRYWVRAQDDPEHPRPGFPGWNRAFLDYDTAFDGKGSLQLPTDGGSTSLLLDPGVIPVFENTDYGVSVRVRTAGLAHASPTLIARFLDRASRPIAESRRSLSPSDEWRELSVEMVGNHADAAFLQIELVLLQPEQAAVTRPLEFNAWPQDFKGAAWFDELIVTQLPRVELSAAGPGNTLTAPDAPRLVGVVRDLTGEDLTTRIEVRDWRGALIDSSERRIGIGRAAIDWAPTITQPGWYRARLEVRSADRSVGGTSVSFVYLPRATPPVTRAQRDPGFSSDRERFTLTLPDWPAPARPLIADLIARAGAAGGTLPFWPRDLTAAAASDAARELAAGPDPMVEQWQTPTLAITRVPDELAASLQLDPVDVWALFTRDPAAWSPYLEPYLERFGQRIRRWQIGETGDGTALSLPDLAERLDRAESVIGRLTPGPILSIPIRADREIPAELIPALDPRRVGIVAALPTDSPPDAVAAFAERWTQAFPATAPDLTLALLTPPGQPDSDDAAPPTIALVKHVVEFWRLFDGPRPARLSLASAWEWTGQRRPQATPRPEVAAWRNLADRLADRRVVGELPAGEGIRCYILAPTPTAPPGRSGALVAWRESGDAPARPIRAFLGEGPITLIDPVGASRPAEIDTAGADPGVQPAVVIPITPEPVFVEGVDAALVRFLASVRIDPEFVICSNEQHEHSIVFENPWPVQMEGRFTIVSPGGAAPTGPRDRSWTFNPRSAPFNIPPGQQARIPISVAFSSATEAGEEQLLIDFELAAARSYGTVRAPARLELGLQNLRMDVRAIPSAPDVSIEATITNTGKEPVTLSLTAFAPGYPRAKASVNELAPGSDVIRKFHYPGGAAKLTGQRIVVGLSDPEAKTHLNKSVTIE
ncbi:MAG: hypothetical protein IT436_11950 [Phycisphaerales bacterium]|nr:hypothetical protein [Phycisphaerales bacterium]